MYCLKILLYYNIQGVCFLGKYAQINTRLFIQYLLFNQQGVVFVFPSFRHTAAILF